MDGLRGPGPCLTRTQDQIFDLRFLGTLEPTSRASASQTSSVPGVQKGPDCPPNSKRAGPFAPPPFWMGFGRRSGPCLTRTQGQILEFRLLGTLEPISRAGAPHLLHGFPGPPGRPDPKNEPHKSGQIAFRYPACLTRTQGQILDFVLTRRLRTDLPG